MRGRKGLYATPGVRFGLTSGHEKAAFVKARARDREVAQRSSLGSSVARQEGRRLGTQHRPLAELSATEVCVTRYRLPVTDLVTKTVNNGRPPCLFHGCVIWDLIPPAGCVLFCPLLQPRLRNPHPATSRNPEVELLHLPHLSSTCTHTCTHDPRGDPAALL